MGGSGLGNSDDVSTYPHKERSRVYRVECLSCIRLDVFKDSRLDIFKDNAELAELIADEHIGYFPDHLVSITYITIVKARR